MSRFRRLLVLATLLALVVGASGTAAPARVAANPTNTTLAGIDIDATTIPQLEALMNAQRLNSVDLTNFYLRRIRQLNPLLNAVITVSPTALADARAADAARRNGDRRPLLGMPIIVKDNIDTTGMPTTAGSWALAGSTPGDAFIVKQLKAAGAFIIGKANLSEWANFRSGPSSSGWSGIGGQTNMPYVLDRNPCGSSSGSGVSAAADLAVAAVGTETDGSVVCPSGANGDVGIKPTLGLWSRAGVVPISANQDSAGPIARNVTDAAVLLGAATGGSRLHRLHAVPEQQRAPRRPNRRLARGHVRPDTGRPGRRADPQQRDRRAEGAGRNGGRPDRHRPLGDRERVPGARVRVQVRHRDIPPHVRPRHEPGDGRRVSADARRPDRLRPGTSEPRGAVERRGVRVRPGDERP
jgi:Asp-tRNA(Asn)/Glu-tRNA(Gln) amidotransferase A subunit family amidase